MQQGHNAMKPDNQPTPDWGSPTQDDRISELEGRLDRLAGLTHYLQDQAYNLRTVKQRIFGADGNEDAAPPTASLSDSTTKQPVLVRMDRSLDALERQVSDVHKYTKNLMQL